MPGYDVDVVFREVVRFRVEAESLEAAKAMARAHMAEGDLSSSYSCEPDGFGIFRTEGHAVEVLEEPHPF